MARPNLNSCNKYNILSVGYTQAKVKYKFKGGIKEISNSVNLLSSTTEFGLARQPHDGVLEDVNVGLEFGTQIATVRVAARRHQWLHTNV